MLGRSKAAELQGSSSRKVCLWYLRSPQYRLILPERPKLKQSSTAGVFMSRTQVWPGKAALTEYNNLQASHLLSRRTIKPFQKHKYLQAEASSLSCELLVGGGCAVKELSPYQLLSSSSWRKLFSSYLEELIQNLNLKLRRRVHFINCTAL